MVVYFHIIFLLGVTLFAVSCHISIGFEGCVTNGTKEGVDKIMAVQMLQKRTPYFDSLQADITLPMELAVHRHFVYRTTQNALCCHRLGIQYLNGCKFILLRFFHEDDFSFPLLGNLIAEVFLATT